MISSKFFTDRSIRLNRASSIYSPPAAPLVGRSLTGCAPLPHAAPKPARRLLFGISQAFLHLGYDEV